MQQEEIDRIIEGVSKKTTDQVDKRLGEAFKHIDDRLTEHTNINLRAHAEHRAAIGKLRRNMISLWRTVRGSDPPPDNDPSDSPLTAPPVPLDELARQGDAKASQADLELDALEARVIVIEQDTAAIKAKTEQTHLETVAQTQILKRLDAVAANPLVRRVAYVLGTAILLWFAAHGVRP